MKLILLMNFLIFFNSDAYSGKNKNIPKKNINPQEIKKNDNKYLKIIEIFDLSDETKSNYYEFFSDYKKMDENFMKNFEYSELIKNSDRESTEDFNKIRVTLNIKNIEYLLDFFKDIIEQLPTLIKLISELQKGYNELVNTYINYYNKKTLYDFFKSIIEVYNKFKKEEHQDVLKMLLEEQIPLENSLKNANEKVNLIIKDLEEIIIKNLSIEKDAEKPQKHKSTHKKFSSFENMFMNLKNISIGSSNIITKNQISDFQKKNEYIVLNTKNFISNRYEKLKIDFKKKFSFSINKKEEKKLDSIILLLINQIKDTLNYMHSGETKIYENLFERKKKQISEINSLISYVETEKNSKIYENYIENYQKLSTILEKLNGKDLDENEIKHKKEEFASIMKILNDDNHINHKMIDNYKYINKVINENKDLI